MKKSPKGRADRRKIPRGRQPRKKVVTLAHGPVPAVDACLHCGTHIGDNDRALFVEEEVGRIFCSEKCIAGYFTPDIERLEKTYYKHLSPGDLSPQEREGLAHLRWITLQEPDEVWREKTADGDFRYALISQFEPGSKKVWSVCICLFLRGEPSFLYLAFATRNPSMVAEYRRGEQVEWVKTDSPQAAGNGQSRVEEAQPEPRSDRLADPWTDDEILRAQLGSERSEDDIPPEQFSDYQSCVQETLEDPDELWSVQLTRESAHLYHFIRRYGEEDPAFWYVVVARETENQEEIEILDVFPTRDLNLVNQYRRGEQEMSRGDEQKAAASGRVVH